MRAKGLLPQGLTIVANFDRGGVETTAIAKSRRCVKQLTATETVHARNPERGTKPKAGSLSHACARADLRRDSTRKPRLVFPDRFVGGTKQEGRRTIERRKRPLEGKRNQRHAGQDVRESERSPESRGPNLRKGIKLAEPQERRRRSKRLRPGRAVWLRVAERRQERRMPRRMTCNGRRADWRSLAWLVSRRWDIYLPLTRTPTPGYFDRSFTREP